MSTLGDEPLNRKRKRKNAAQVEAETAQQSAARSKWSQPRDSVPDMPIPVQTMIPPHNPNPYKALHELNRTITGEAWLRIVPMDDDGITHWYVKYNSGRWKEHYLYYGQTFNDDELDAIEFLINRWREVKSGLRKPFRDNRFVR